MTQRTAHVLRDGPFVQIRLPEPGKWVIVMRPNTALELGAVILRGEQGKYDVGGITVTIKKKVVLAEGTVWIVTFADWPGKLVLRANELREFERELRQAMQKRREVGVPSSADLTEVAM